MASARQLGREVAAISGSLLQGMFATVSRLRPADKPLHPRGTLYTASIERHGLTDPIGVPWIDDPGRSSALVRLSRAVGLPASVPDIYGLALRLPARDGGGDILFATTGAGALTRFILFPAQHAGQRAYTTLLPYRTSVGPVTLAATPIAAHERVFDLSCARVGRSWRTFARMTLVEAADQGSPSFDPVLNQVPGLGVYPWIMSLREGAYRAARRSRSEDR